MRCNEAPESANDKGMPVGLVDRQIDGVLQAFGDADPSPSFAARMERTLAAHRDGIPPRSAAPFGLRGSRLWSRQGLYAVAVCGLLIVLGLLRLRTTSPRVPPAVPTVATVQTSPVRKPLPAAEHRGPAIRVARAVRAEKIAASTPIHLAIGNSAPPSTGAIVATDDLPSARTLDASALEDLHTGSFPAPSMPPTSQERLVRLMLRRGEKHDLAQLDPAQATRLADTEQRMFQMFFDPDPSPELALELKKGHLH